MAPWILNPAREFLFPAAAGCAQPPLAETEVSAPAFAEHEAPRLCYCLAEQASGKLAAAHTRPMPTQSWLLERSSDAVQEPWLGRHSYSASEVERVCTAAGGQGLVPAPPSGNVGPHLLGTPSSVSGIGAGATKSVTGMLAVAFFMNSVQIGRAASAPDRPSLL